MIILKTEEEIEIMREGGRRHARILEEIRKAVKPGVSTWELDQLAFKLVKDGGDRPAFLGYTPAGARHPYPATLCVSVNEEIVHGIPHRERFLKEGDIVTVDLGVQHRGLFTDAAITVPVGNVSKELSDMISVAEESMMVGIKAAEAGKKVGDIGHAIEKFIDARYGIVRDFAGHGVGRAIHEDPHVPNYGRPNTGETLEIGMTLAIEPMLALRKAATRTLSDGYTVITADKSPAVHFEHTIAITRNGPVVLTQI